MSAESSATAVRASTATVSPPVLGPARRLEVLFAFFAIYAIWGSTYLAIRFAVETIPPFYTAGIRHFVAGIILLAWCLAKRLRPTRAQVRASIIIGAFFFLGGQPSFSWAATVRCTGPSRSCLPASLLFLSQASPSGSSSSPPSLPNSGA